MKRFSVLILFVLLLAGCVGGKGCRPDNPPPPTATHPAPPTPKVTPPATSTPVRATATATLGSSPTATHPAATVTPTPDLPTATHTRQPDAPQPTATPELIGHHTVVFGDTMFEVGLEWYAGRYFAWGREVWEPICAANPYLVDCRIIYPGDILAIPALP
jgi:hypothetical protein